MIAANITPPRGPICGKCNIRVSFFKPVEALTRANIRLRGDTEGIDYQISRSVDTWVLAFVYPQDVRGKVRLALTGEVTPIGSDAPVAIEPTEISFSYDTCNTITAEWGEPIRQGKLITLPITFSQALVGLKKGHFRVEMDDYNVRSELVGIGDTGRTYHLRMRPPRGVIGTIEVSLVRPVRKHNGLAISVKVNHIEVVV